MIIWKKKLIECCKCHKRYSFDDNLFYHLKEYILICPNCNLMHKVDIQLLGKEYEGLKKIDKLNLTAIDIGSIASDRGGSFVPVYTLINKDNPALYAGTITTIEIFANGGMTNVEIAIFTQISENHFTTRSNVAIGNVDAGEHSVSNGNPITVDSGSNPISLPVEVGDFIGIYYTGSNIEADTSGYLGVWYKSADNIPCIDTTFSFLSGYTMSLKGIGATPAPIEMGSAATNRATYTGNGATRISLDTPANATGKITSIEIWVNADMTGLKVATFYLVGTTYYSTRDYITIGDATAGYHKYTTDGGGNPINMDVTEGDYIGLYNATGRLEVDTGQATNYRANTVNDYIPCTNQNFNTLVSGQKFSLHATGATEEEEANNAIMMGMNF